MSRLEELIQELCPDGVEYRKLGDIADVSIGLATSVTKYKRDSGVLLLHNSDIQQGRIELKNIEYIDDSFAKKNSSKLLRKNDIITVHTGDVGTSAVITDEYVGAIGFTTITSRIKDFNQVYPYYLSTYFNSHKCKMDIRKMTISDRSNLNQKDFIKIQVPVPPLEVQREIVRILDSFTLLTAELTAELTARKKQYEYYRDTLLGRKTVETEEVFLEDIATYSKERISANEVDEYSYVGVDNLLQEKRGKTVSSHVPTDGNLTKYYPGDILIGNIRPYLRKIWFADNIGGTNGDVLVIHVTSDKVLPQYLYYNLSSERFFEYDIAKSKGAKMPRGDKDAVMKYNLLLPPTATQKRIVDILDRFDSLCNSISEGLPAEIEARQKQYEFYRDKLLSFEQL